MRRLVGDWEDFLNTDTETDEGRLFQLHERTGKPLGDNTFIEKLEFDP